MTRFMKKIVFQNINDTIIIQCPDRLIHEDSYFDEAGVGISRHSVWNHASKSNQCSRLISQIPNVLKQINNCAQPCFKNKDITVVIMAEMNMEVGILYFINF